MNKKKINIPIEKAKELVKILQEGIDKSESPEKYNEAITDCINYDKIIDFLYHKNVCVFAPFTILGENQIRSYDMRRDYFHVDFKNWCNCLTKKQVKRLIAFNKLQNIANYLYLKDGFKPDFDNPKATQFVIFRSEHTQEPYLAMQGVANSSFVYFKTEEDAEAAIKMMGKKSLDDLFIIE